MGFLDVAAPLTNMIGAFVNRDSQRETNQMQMGLAKDQMDFQQRNSDTAHQREVKDLEAAGLNPILSAGGSGSSSPQGAQAQLTAPQIDLPDMMAYGVSMKQLDQASQKLAIDQQHATNETAHVANETAATNAQLPKTAEETKKAASEIELNKLEKVLKQKGMIRANLEKEGSGLLQQGLKMLKDQVQKPKIQNIHPGQTDFEHFTDEIKKAPAFDPIKNFQQQTQ